MQKVKHAMRTPPILVVRKLGEVTRTMGLKQDCGKGCDTTLLEISYLPFSW